MGPSTESASCSEGRGRHEQRRWSGREIAAHRSTRATESAWEGSQTSRTHRPDEAWGARVRHSEAPIQSGPLSCPAQRGTPLSSPAAPLHCGSPGGRRQSAGAGAGKTRETLALSHSGRFAPKPRHSSRRRTHVWQWPSALACSSHFWRERQKQRQ